MVGEPHGLSRVSSTVSRVSSMVSSMVSTVSTVSSTVSRVSSMVSTVSSTVSRVSSMVSTVSSTVSSMVSTVSSMVSSTVSRDKVPERDIRDHNQGGFHMSRWSYADIMSGRMLVGGPAVVKSCQECGSPNISRGGSWSDPWIRRADCGSKFGGASAKA